jgi:hypothetical protein
MAMGFGFAIAAFAEHHLAKPKRKSKPQSNPKPNAKSAES